MKKMKKLWMFLLSLTVVFCCVQTAPLEAAAVNDYTQWRQYDSEWNQQEAWPASQYPDTNMRWMSQAGCVVTSIAMLVRHYGVVADGNVNTFNPWICNEKLKRAGAFTSGAALYWGKVASAFPGMTYQNTVSYSAEKLSSLFNQGYACIVKVAGGSHYVAIRDAKSAGKIVTMDPGSNSTSLSIYGGGSQIIYFRTSGRPGAGNHVPIGSLDAVTGENGRVYVSGWAIDPDSPRTPLDIHIYIGGTGYILKANQSRPDVEKAHSNLNPGPYHGFSGWIETEHTGDVTVWGAALDTIEGTNLTWPGRTIHINPGIQDTTPPVISDITVEKDVQGYTVRCTVTDDFGISKVIFPTWTLNNGQDDHVPDWTVNPSAEGTISGSTVSYRVNISDHFYEYGTYITDIYAYDIKGNVTSDQVFVDMDTEKDTPVERISMHRLYNPNSGEHFYTGLEKEKNFLSKSGWKYEGISWTAPSFSTTPVYRLYNPHGGDHHYTTSRNERDFLIQAGWKDEGTGWYSDKNNGVPLYRLYNPNARTGSHHYTTEIRERDFLRQNGWNYEGIAWYGMN